VRYHPHSSRKKTPWPFLEWFRNRLIPTSLHV